MLLVALWAPCSYRTPQPHIYLQLLLLTWLWICLILSLQAGSPGGLSRNSWQPILSSWNNLGRHPPHTHTFRWVSSPGCGPHSYRGMTFLLNKVNSSPGQEQTQDPGTSSLLVCEGKEGPQGNIRALERLTFSVT